MSATTPNTDREQTAEAIQREIDALTQQIDLWPARPDLADLMRQERRELRRQLAEIEAAE